jgi:hypothetical protein
MENWSSPICPCSESDSNSIEIEDKLDRYERLKLQRLNASKKWNNANRDKVNEYNKFYQRRLNAKKRENRATGVTGDCDVIAKDSEAVNYKMYQECYRKTARLRKLPFFNSDIVF